MSWTNLGTLFNGAITHLKGLPLWLFLSASLSFALTILLVSVSESNQQRVAETWQLLRDARDRTDVIEEIRTQLLNAETAQRGFLLTGNADYLAPVIEAQTALAKLQNSAMLPFPQMPNLQNELAKLSELVLNKLTEIHVTIELYKTGKREEAMRIASNNSGKLLMDEARANIFKSIGLLNNHVAQLRTEMSSNMLISRLSIAGIALLNLALLGAAMYVFSQDLKTKELIVEIKDTENHRLSALVADRTSELNELATHLQASSETERATIARDLHDELGGVLTSAMMDVNWVLQRVQPIPGAVERLTKASVLLDQAVSVKRRVIENLRPSLLDNLGLTAALEWYVNENCVRGGLAYTLDVPQNLPNISSDASIALFRIVQEAMTNTLRYAQAKNFSVSIAVDTDSIHLIVEDDGIGLPAQFNPTKLSHGLSGIRQRARALKGEVEWASLPKEGTKLIVTVPRKLVETENDPEAVDVALN